MTVGTMGCDGEGNGIEDCCGVLMTPLLRVPLKSYISAQTPSLLRIHALAKVQGILPIKKARIAGFLILQQTIASELSASGAVNCAAAS